MQFANGPGVKFVQAIVDSGELTASTFLRSVVPAGDEARCDFIQVDAFKGIPGGPLSKEQLAAVMQKSGVGMTPEQFMAKRESLARLVSMEYWRTQISVGDIQKGDYLYINSMKVPNMADYRKVEETVWKPMAEEWVKNGRMRAWRMTTLFLPSGAEAKYQAVSVDVFPNWNAVFTPLNMEETFKKIHPDKDIQQTFSEIGKARTLARRELYVVQERLTPGTKISQR